MEDAAVFLAVARGGSLEAASQSLGVNYTTIYRRLLRLEARCGGALFDRHGSSYTPNERGTALLDAALRLEREAAAFEREVMSRATELEAHVRLTVVASLMPLIRSDLAAFRERHPKVSLGVDTSMATVDLVRGDADVAIHATDTPDERLVGRKIADVAWAAYSRQKCSPRDLAWVGYVDAMRAVSAIQFARREWGDCTEAYRVASLDTMVQLLGASDVVGYLPCHVGDAEPGLYRVSEPRSHGSAWVLYAPELRRSRPVLALVECLVAGLTRCRPILEGRRS